MYLEPQQLRLWWPGPILYSLTLGCVITLDPRRHSLVTHPLRTAPPRHLYSPGAWTVPAGQPHILTAQRQAGEAACVTAAEDPAIGLKGLPIQVPVAVHLTASIIIFHCTGRGKQTSCESWPQSTSQAPCPSPGLTTPLPCWPASLLSKTERHPGAWLGPQLQIFLTMDHITSLLASVSLCEKTVYVGTYFTVCPRLNEIICVTNLKK